MNKILIISTAIYKQKHINDIYKWDIISNLKMLLVIETVTLLDNLYAILTFSENKL